MAASMRVSSGFRAPGMGENAVSGKDGFTIMSDYGRSDWSLQKPLPGVILEQFDRTDITEQYLKLLLPRHLLHFR